MNMALLLTDPELKDCLDLVESETQVHEPGTANYYIHSSTMKVEQLRDVMAALIKDDPDAHYPEIDAWTSEIETHNLKDPNHVHIRYVGMSDYVRGLGRLNQSIRQSANNSVLGTFAHKLIDICGDVWHEGKTWEIPRATVPPLNADLRSIPQERKDDRERLLIALLGSDSLLNRQLGGKFMSYVPRAEDNILFSSLQTSVVQKLSRLEIAEPTDAIKSGVSSWMDRIMNFAAKYPPETGTNLTDISDALKEL